MRIGRIVKPYLVGALAGFVFTAPMVTAALTENGFAVLGVSSLCGCALWWLHEREWISLTAEPRQLMF